MAYEKPTVTRLGTLEQLTLTKELGFYDIIWLIPIKNDDPGGGIHAGS